MQWLLQLFAAAGNRTIMEGITVKVADALIAALIYVFASRVAWSVTVKNVMGAAIVMGVIAIAVIVTVAIVMAAIVMGVEIVAEVTANAIVTENLSIIPNNALKYQHYIISNCII